MAETPKKKPGKRHRKHGRNKRKPCNMRYLREDRCAKNKARRAARRARELTKAEAARSVTG